MGSKARKKQGIASLLLASLLLLTWIFQGTHLHGEETDHQLDSPCVLCQLAPQTDQALIVQGPLPLPVLEIIAKVFPVNASLILTYHNSSNCIRGPPALA